MPNNDDHLITDPDEVRETIKRLPIITDDTRICPRCVPPVPLTPLSNGDYHCDGCHTIWTREAIAGAMQ